MNSSTLSASDAIACLPSKVKSPAAKFNAVTGWKSRVTLEEGMARTVDYYRRHRAHYW